MKNKHNNNIKKIVIVGLPNTGKSQIFNDLTREYSPVANSPLTTIEIIKGYYTRADAICEVFDTPGLNSLYIHSEEQLIVRDMLFREKPDVIIQCIDANRLKQSLFLTADILGLGVPMIISLNSVKETDKKGFDMNLAELSLALGVPVFESLPGDRDNIACFKERIEKAVTGSFPVVYDREIEDAIEWIGSRMPEGVSFKRKISELILLDDDYLGRTLAGIMDDRAAKDIRIYIDNFKAYYKGNVTRAVNNRKNEWVSSVFKRSVKKEKIFLEGFSHKLSQLSRHPVFGVPILLSILSIMFLAVVNIADFIMSWAETYLWQPVETGIGSVVTSPFWKDFLIGHYGVLTLGISNALLTVLPILSIYFFLYNLLEDMGYIPNLCVLSKRILEKAGLSGNAIMPITLGFGCKTMATITTRSLRSAKERYISIFLIAFAIPCAAQMALNMNILGRMGFMAFLIAFLVLAFVEMCAGLVLNRMIKGEKTDDFIQELPDIRFPSFKAVIKRTYFRLRSFMKEALKIFVIAALVLFTADKTGLLGMLKNVLSPVVTGFLGFPREMVDVLILCMARQEAAAGMIISLIRDGRLDYVQSIVAVVITTMFVPCFANIMAMIKELGLRSALVMLAAINGVSILVAGILNRVLVIFIR